MSKFTVFFLCLIFLSGANISRADEGSGMDEKLFKLQLGLAEKGDSKSQYFMGEMHEYGLGTPPNLDEAFKWYAKAAEQGNPLAIRKLGHRVEIENSVKNKHSSDSTDAADTANDKAGAEEKKRTGEREKRRAAVRAMIRERMKHPVGAPFE
jgi:TPR repeat protein